MPQPTLSSKSRHDLEAARTKARSAATQLRISAGQLQTTSNFNDEILLHREYPGKLRYALRRGAKRLERSADALESFDRSCGVVLGGGTAPRYREPGWGNDVDGWTARTAAGRHSLLPDQASELLRKIEQQAETATAQRKNVKQVLRLLGQVEASKQTAHLAEAVQEADSVLHTFAEWIVLHRRHARRMVNALMAWDTDDFKGALPPLKIKKPRKPTVKRPDGKGTGGKAPLARPGKWPGNGAGKQARACWLARSASAKGLPPTLAVVCSLVESDLKNVTGGDADSTGFFQIRVGVHPVPAGFGSASGQHRNEAWWAAHPEAQIAWFAAEARRTKPPGEMNTAAEISEWAARLERPAAQYRGRYAQRYAEAKKLVDKCSQSSGGGGGARPNSGGAKPTTKGGVNAVALQKALAELRAGVKEVGGEDRGAKVSEYLRGAGIGGPAPWCAAFVKWCYKQAGFKWPPGNWAYCPNFLNEAKKDKGIFYPVSHTDARPGDLIVWYGHIGIVKSEGGGSITYVAGNQSDKVTQATISTSASGYQILRPRAQ